MKYMIGFPVAWLIVYLIFSFITLSFSIFEWSEAYRVLCAVFGMTWGVALSYRINQDCTWSY